MDGFKTKICILPTMFKGAKNVQWRDDWIICKKCDEWLTQPIFLHSDNKHYCATCSSKEENGYRNEVLENYIKDCMFPCKYELCFAWLPFEKILNHEQSCKFTCCLWCFFCNVPYTWDHQYLNHLAIKHADHFKAIDIPTPKIQLSLHPNSTKLAIVTHKFNTFSIYTKNTNDGFWCCVTKYPFVNNDDTNEFNLKLTSAGSDEILNFKGQCIVPYLFSKDSSFTIVKNKLQEESEITITFTKCNPDMKIAECPICFERMTGTILICGNGHPVCEDCGFKIVNCAECRTKMDGVRLNISRIIPNIQVPCRYANMGCLKLETADTIETHSQICGYRPINCWKCKETIAQNVSRKHILKHFIPFKYNSFAIDALKKETNMVVIMFTTCNEHIFRLKSKYSPNNNFSFLVQAMNYDDNNIENKFEYKIMFLDFSKSTFSNVILQGKCQRRTQNKITSVLTYQQYEKLHKQKIQYIFCYVHPTVTK